MDTISENRHDGKGPQMAQVGEKIAAVEGLEVDEALKQRAAEGEGQLHLFISIQQLQRVVWLRYSCTTTT